MFATKHGRTVGLVAAFALFGFADRALGQARGAPQPEIRGILKTVNAGTITISFPEGREGAVADKTFTLVKDVEIAIAGVSSFGGGRGGLFKPGKLTDLPTGSLVSLSLTADQKAVYSILADGPTVRGVLKAADAKKKTMTVSTPLQREPAGDDKTYSLADDVEIVIDDGRGRRYSFKEGKLEDLSENALVTLRLSMDRKQVQSVLAEGAMLHGAVKSVDATKKSLTLVLRPARGDDAAEERTVPVAVDATVLLDDGKGRRLSLKEARLADLPVGGMATVKLSVDQAFAMLVRVEGPMLMGLFKAADADKGTITIAIPKGRDDADEKTFALSKDVRITIDGSTSKLADLKAGENGTVVQVRLSLDQKTVQSVTARQSIRQ